MSEFNTRRIKVQIMFRARFFGSLLHNIKIVEDDRIPTACIDKNLVVRINRDFMEGTTCPICHDHTEEEQIFVICHELLHGVFLHVFRIFEWVNKDAQRMGNRAADYLVNYVCKEMKLQMPKCVQLYNPKYNPNDYTLESLVKELLKQQQQQQQQQQSGIDGCDIEEGESDASEESKIKQREIEEKIKSSLSSAIMQAKKAGELPASLNRFCQDILEPKIHWREALAEWFNVRVRSVKTWEKPHRKMAILGRYAPTNFSLGCGHIGIAVDVSASIGQKELDVFGSELNYIFEKCKPSKVTVCYFDTDKYVREFEEYPIKLETCGGGGTRFDIPINFFNNECEEPINGLVFMTDGEGNWPSEEPLYPLVVLCTNPRLKAPYGTTIYCDLNGNS